MFLFRNFLLIRYTRIHLNFWWGSMLLIFNFLSVFTLAVLFLFLCWFFAMCLSFLIDLREHLTSPQVFLCVWFFVVFLGGGEGDLHLFRLLCCVFGSLCFRSVSCAKNCICLFELSIPDCPLRISLMFIYDRICIFPYHTISV